jgi:Predicted glycosyltransferases
MIKVRNNFLLFCPYFLLGFFWFNLSFLNLYYEVVLIRNEHNNNYPTSQNQGIKIAKYNILCFFNNDIIVSPRWDLNINEFCKINPTVEVFSVSSNDNLGSKVLQRKTSRKWKRIKYSLKFMLGINEFSLNLMLKLMYGNWKKFCDKKFLNFGLNSIEGYSGSVIFIKKSALGKIGLWDERIQAGDFDIFNRVKKRSMEKKDIIPIQLILGIYFHHFIRMTSKSKFPPFHHQEKMMTIEAKWGKETEFLRKDLIV